MNGEELKQHAGALGASIALHALGAALLLVAPAVLPAESALDPQEITVEIAILPEPPPPEPLETPPDEMPEPEEPQEPPEPEAIEPQRPAAVAIIERPRPEPIAPQPEPSEPAPQEAEAATIQRPQVPPDRAPAPDPEAERERLRVLLDPMAVARGYYVPEGEPSVPQAPQSGGPPVDRGPTEQEVERQLDEHLRERAMVRPHITRTHPNVVARPDGTHFYDGPNFDVTIGTDGSVTFSDRPGLQFDGFSAQNMTFDLNDMFMGAQGQDPYFAEREWFMEETQELRERIEDEYAAQLRAREPLQAARDARAAWRRRGRSAERRRREIFEIWDSIPDDADGRSRAAIEQFIQEELPQGSEHAYGEEELSRLNASRESHAEFNPYR